MTYSKERMNAFDLNLKERQREKKAKRSKLSGIKDFFVNRNESESRLINRDKYPFTDYIEYSTIEDRTNKVSKSMSRDFSNQFDPELKVSYLNQSEIK